MKKQIPDLNTPTLIGWVSREPCLLLEKKSWREFFILWNSPKWKQTKPEKEAPSIIKLDNCHLLIHKLKNSCQTVKFRSYWKRTQKFHRHKEQGHGWTKAEVANTPFAKSQGTKNFKNPWGTYTEGRKSDWPQMFLWQHWRSIEQHLEILEGKQMWLKNLMASHLVIEIQNHQK